MEIIIKNNEVVPLSECTRIEVVDDSGRAYVNWSKNNNIKLSLQDDGKTLKIFINKK